MRILIGLGVLICFVTLIAPRESSADLKRGLQNYLDILNGKKTLEQLPVDQAEEVLIISQRLQRPQGTSSFDETYVIQASAKDEWFVINNNKYQAKTYCFGFNKGNRVKFIQGSPYGACATAIILNLQNDTTCDVWCE